MTIEEAILHCDDVTEKKSQFCDDFEKSCGNEHEQLSKWLEELKVLREENAELKRLLRFALEDFEMLSNEVDSRYCDFDFICKFCPFSSNDNDGYIECAEKWKHADEALKLIGGE